MLVEATGPYLEGSNCTFMELKYVNTRQSKRSLLRSNCTFMELKFSKPLALFRTTGVLIVPLWN